MKEIYDKKNDIESLLIDLFILKYASFVAEAYQIIIILSIYFNFSTF